MSSQRVVGGGANQGPTGWKITVRRPEVWEGGFPLN